MNLSEFRRGGKRDGRVVKISRNLLLHVIIVFPEILFHVIQWYGTKWLESLKNLFKIAIPLYSSEIISVLLSSCFMEIISERRV